jgi:diguanylate cyclase (GGDEF)-like protein
MEWPGRITEEITEYRKAKDIMNEAHDEPAISAEEWPSDLERANAMLRAEIAERKKVERKLRDLSEKDYLTMIFNRRKLFELLDSEIEKARRYSRPLSLIIFDLDHFKEVNDSYGHLAGDSVLKATAAVVEAVIRKNDIFARYGGEEFIVLTPETALNGARSLAEKIRAAIEQNAFEHAGSITVSAGVSEFSTGDTDASFIEKADRALYDAKRKGRNRIE